MSSGVFEVDLIIKGKKFTDPVNVIEELNENIIGIDFIHAHKLWRHFLESHVYGSWNQLNRRPEKYSITGYDLNSDKS